MTARAWVRFGLLLGVLLTVSVSVEPLLPWWVAPPLVLLLVVASAIDGALAVSAAAAIWGGLAADLLSPGQFGVRWLALVVVALAVRESRRVVAIRDLPWLWPIWFGVGAFLATLPLALLTHQLPLAGRTAIAAAIWGPLALVGTHWIVASRRDTER